MLAQTTVKPVLKDYNLNEVSLIGSREDTIRRAISEVIRLIQSLEHRRGVEKTYLQDVLSSKAKIVSRSASRMARGKTPFSSCISSTETILSR